MTVKNLLPVIALLIFSFSLLNIGVEVVPNRWLRIFTSVIFLVLALNMVSPKKMLLGGAVGILVLCDFFLLNWEVSFSKHFYYSFHSVVVLSLFLMIIKDLKKPDISLIEGAYLLLIFIINSIILVSLGGFLSSGSDGLSTLFYINGFSIIFLVIVAFLYSLNISNKNSAFFFLAILGLTISDLMLFAIYFMEVGEFRFVDNAFYVLGLFFLLKASLEQNCYDREKRSLREESKKEEQGIVDVQIQKIYS